jgi:hypothetical protein
MVNRIRKALAGFILIPGGSQEPPPKVPYVPEEVRTRACPLRGFSDKSKDMQVLVLPGAEEADVLRNLRSVVVEGDRAPRKANARDGVNLVVFRGVFGSGGYDIDVRSVRLKNRILEIECDFENPGSGIRTTAGFTQPTAIIPLRRLPAGKYQVRLWVRQLSRSSQGVEIKAPSREAARTAFKFCA